jgi:hypothetical protein
MTETTARPELPEGPWNYDYHGDWSTYAMGLQGTVRVEFEQIHEDDKIAISDLFEQAPCMLDELQAGIETAQDVIDTWAQGDLAAAVNALQDWMKAAQAVVAKAQPTTQGE